MQNTQAEMPNISQLFEGFAESFNNSATPNDQKMLSDKRIEAYSDYIDQLTNAARSKIEREMVEGKPVLPHALRVIDKESKRAIKKFKNTMQGLEMMESLDKKDQDVKDMAGVTLTLVLPDKEEPEAPKALGMSTVLERMKMMKNKIEENKVEEAPTPKKNTI